MTFTIDELTIPANLDDADDFRDLVRVRNEVELGILRSEMLLLSPESIAPMFRDNADRRQRHFIARVDGVAAGRGRIAWRTAQDATSAGLTIDVLENCRRQGIGQALLDTLESAAAEVGRKVLQADLAHTASPDGERLLSPTGFGSLPTGDPGVRFLLRNAYVLEFIGRISGLEANPGIVAEHRSEADARAGADYRLVLWVGRTPDEWLPDLAILKTRMSTDAPMAGLEIVEDRWDVERVRAGDDRESEGGRDKITAAAEHVPSGALVGYTELTFPAGGGPYAIQEDTLVLREHRGHRLGMLLKAANLERLAAMHPGMTVTTFNAEDNRPMLDVNEALGFEPIGLEGNWQKRV